MTIARSGIYKIVNKINGKYYIGSSKDLRGPSYGRWKTHICKLKSGVHPNPHLQNAWNKYGQSNFEFLIIEETSDLISREQHYLDRASLEKYNCYNISYQADRLEMTPEIRQKISQSSIGKRGGALHPFFGKKHTADSRAKISNSQIGRVSPNKGKSLSQDQKDKIRQTLLAQRNEISEKNSKEWDFLSPSGTLTHIINLYQFCKDNHLQMAHMCNVFYGRRPHHKGWKRV